MNDISLLQHYWWFLVSLLGALLVFLMFVQGGQSLIWTLGRTEEQRRMLLLATGRKWELTFTTLVTFGGAFFASFPLFYSTSFGGAYWVWVLILLCFVLQAVSYEFQLKRGNLLGTTTYRIFLMLNGILGPLLIGTAVGTFFTGAEFVVDKSAVTSASMPVISHWANSLHGLEAAFVPQNLLLGISVLLLTRVLACLYFINSIGDSALQLTCRRRLAIESAFFLLFFLTWLVRWLCAYGYAWQPADGSIYMEEYKYLHNLLAMPAVLALLSVGVVLVLCGMVTGLRGWHRAIWPAGIGSVFVVLALLLCAGWNHTAYYPSVVAPQCSLTIANSSSSLFTLRTMTYVSFIIPFVLAYIAWAWRALDRTPITPEEANEKH
ncbi:MAG: cytochrome d ubiquinol oxidase subunit II [Akkermansia sp.]|jgi:cytochrome d ubiquinol oxidase subunit II|nr:cytochrome d ubiquinol oxidase subunit II [Akkermansia sp.]